MRVRTMWGAMTAVVLLAVPAVAHHSHGNYNMDVMTTLKGTVKEVHWMNPHSFIYLEVADDKGGEPATWSLESQSITQLARRGVSKDLVKPGDRISVRCHTLRDGSNGCLLSVLTTGDGKDTLMD